MDAFSLGWMYTQGLGRDQDFTAVADLYQRAADLGIVNAHHNLEQMYLEGAKNSPKVFQTPFDISSWLIRETSPLLSVA